MAPFLCENSRPQGADRAHVPFHLGQLFQTVEALTRTMSHAPEEIVSRTLGTAEMQEVLPESGPTTLLLDVMPGSEQPDPYWYGAVQLFVTIPDLGLNDVFLGQGDLTGLPEGQYSTISAPVSAEIVQALRENSYFDARFKAVVNLPGGAPPLVIDHLRFPTL